MQSRVVYPGHRAVDAVQVVADGFPDGVHFQEPGRLAVLVLRVPDPVQLHQCPGQNEMHIAPGRLQATGLGQVDLGDHGFRGAGPVLIPQGAKHAIENAAGGNLLTASRPESDPVECGLGAGRRYQERPSERRRALLDVLVLVAVQEGTPELRQGLEGLNDVARDRVLGQNAIDAYNLPL